MNKNISMNTQELMRLYNKTITYKPHISINNNSEKIIGISGASGFLGLHLLDKMVNQPNISHIKCFIRNRDKFNYKKDEFKLNFKEDKLEFITEIKESHFNDINNFIHSAAQLHNLKNIKQLWNDNITFTEQLLQYNKNKFHYISTLSVFASSNHKGTSYPNYILEKKEHELYGGYAQTKWLGEYLVSQYPEHQILRLGLLTPPKSHPYFQSHEFFLLFFKLLRELKSYPLNYEEAFVDISPVNEVSSHILEYLDKNEKIAHIANKSSISLSSILEKMNLKTINKEQWLLKIKSLKKIEQIFLMYTFFKSEAIIKYPLYFNIDLFQSTNHKWLGKIENNDIIQSYIEHN